MEIKFKDLQTTQTQTERLRDSMQLCAQCELSVSLIVDDAVSTFLLFN